MYILRQRLETNARIVWNTENELYEHLQVNKKNSEVKIRLEDVSYLRAAKRVQNPT